MSIHSNETHTTRLRRRLLTVPGITLLFAVLLCLAPGLLAMGLVVDLLGQRRLATCRAVLLLILYLGCGVIGILCAGAIWSARALGLSKERSQSCYFRLQCWWAHTLLDGATRLYRLRFRVEGAEAINLERPLILLIRHSSIADTLVPAALLSEPLGLRLRYVLKHELLIDPCLDLVGNQLPNVFVRRGSEQSEQEILRIGKLAQSMSPGEGVLIYPEGSRFSTERRTHILQQMRAADSPWLAKSEALRHVLPPRPGGTLALLGAAQEADVLVCAHHGFEATRTPSQLLRGALIGQQVHVAFWSVPRSKIPVERDAQSAWLYALWSRMDAWLEAHPVEGPNE